MIVSAVMALGALLLLMTTVWCVSLVRDDVSIVDNMWGIALLSAGLVYMFSADATWTNADGFTRPVLVLGLLSIWALRLAIYLTYRSRGRGEDKRYRAMRERRGPGFRWASLAVVFWLQAFLAWVISLPLLVAIQASSQTSLGSASNIGVFGNFNLVDVAGVLLFAVGFIFETVGDWQLVRFKSNPVTARTVCDIGLWRYTRHPNYFGEALLWWGFWCFAIATTFGLWTVVSPVLMTFLLLRVSGVRLLESSLLNENANYYAYTLRTSAFIPWFPKTPNRGRSIDTNG